MSLFDFVLGGVLLGGHSHSRQKCEEELQAEYDARKKAQAAHEEEQLRNLNSNFVSMIVYLAAALVALNAEHLGLPSNPISMLVGGGMAIAFIWKSLDVTEGVNIRDRRSK